MNERRECHVGTRSQLGESDVNDVFTNAKHRPIGIVPRSNMIHMTYTLGFMN